LDRSKYASAEGLKFGAYVLAESDPNPDVILMATGSELQHVVGAYEQLSKEGINVRVVSFPSWELFEKQSAEYKKKVLPPNVHARVAVEAGTSLGWKEYIGDRGKVIARTDFGASAPIKDLLKHFGFTVENVVKEAKSLLEKK
jgi:transketolase